MIHGMMLCAGAIIEIRYLKMVKGVKKWKSEQIKIRKMI